MLFANLLERTYPRIIFLPTSPSRVLPSSTIRFSSKVAARRRSLSTIPKENGWTHVDPRYRIRRCRLYPCQSRRHQRFRFASPLLRPFCRGRWRRKILINQLLCHTTVDISAAVAAIGQRGGTECSYGTSEISPSLVNGSRNDLLALTLLFRN